MDASESESDLTSENHPCPRCGASIQVSTIHRITDADQIEALFRHAYNRAHCPQCNAPFTSPHILKIRLPEHPYCDHDCIPFALLDQPSIVQALIQEPTPAKRVYSYRELQRSLEAELLYQMHREAEGQIQ